jgi:hypothetical protein
VVVFTLRAQARPVTLCVVVMADAERPERRYHAERGNDHHEWIAGMPRCVVCPNILILIVPTLCVGMHCLTLCVIPDNGRGASSVASPRRAWGRSFEI